MTNLDQYGTQVEVPSDFGPSTNANGDLFAEISGTTEVKTLNGDRQGKFTITANGFALGTRGSYNAALDFCAGLGLIAVDCTR